MSYREPREVAEVVAQASERKAVTPVSKLVILGVLAGVYIAFGGMLSIVVSTGAERVMGFGPSRFLAGSVFSLGLIMVILGGAELFTGNNLMVIGYLSHRISLRAMLFNWVVVYAANFLGSLLIVVLVYGAGLLSLGGGRVAVVAAGIAGDKIGLGFTVAVVRGIGANWLVCAAVWLAAGGKSNLDRILGIYFPVMAFVALGLEHSVGNMFLVPIGIIAAHSPGVAGASELTWGGFLFNNLLPVTIGNIIGGAGLVGAAYWYVYRYPRPVKRDG